MLTGVGLLNRSNTGQCSSTCFCRAAYRSSVSGPVIETLTRTSDRPGSAAAVEAEHGAEVEVGLDVDLEAVDGDALLRRPVLEHHDLAGRETGERVVDRAGRRVVATETARLVLLDGVATDPDGAGGAVGRGRVGAELGRGVGGVGGDGFLQARDDGREVGLGHGGVLGRAADWATMMSTRSAGIGTGRGEASQDGTARNATRPPRGGRGRASGRSGDGLRERGHARSDLQLRRPRRPRRPAARRTGRPWAAPGRRGRPAAGSSAAP